MRSSFRPFLFTLAVAALVPSPARAERVFEKGDLVLNVGALIQADLRFIGDGNPDGKLAIDPMIRRGRILAYGNLTKTISFFTETESANIGLAGNWNNPFYLLDAYISFGLIEDLNLDVGIILAPFSHHGIQGATSLNTVDYHLSLLRYPASMGKVLRDAGVQVRGFLLDKMIHYRFAIMNGTEGAKPAATDPAGTPAVNPSDIPRFTGQLRFNLMGNEPGFFIQGIYFAKDPIISVGISADGQPDALRVGTSLAGYLGLAADVFCDYPLDATSEIVAQLAFYKYSQGDKTSNTGIGMFGEVGYRMDMIEPVISAEWFRPTDVPKDQSLQWRVGLNYFIEKHRANVKAEIGQNRVGEGSGTKSSIISNVQAQLFF